ncbi:MAG: GTP-binding protein [Candidatus Heimdallarchaeota archaeon]|nr:MAG: GTP-binding protein [Candidatus Heimdallarchaeota archaeon]
MTKTIQVLLYGLENSGKSTLIRSYQKNLFTPGIPSTVQKFHEIKQDNLVFNIIEVGGRKEVRKLVFEYLDHVDSIMFAIDGNDETRFKDIQNEFGKILNHPSAADKPIAVLFNKKDITQVHPATIVEKLDLLHRYDRPHQVFSTTAKNPQTFRPVLTWIDKCLTETDFPLPDRFSRFLTIYLLDMLASQKKGLPLLSILGQLKIISGTGQVEYDRDKIISLLRKLLKSGEIAYDETSKIWRITEKGLEQLESSKLIEGDKYEELREFLVAAKTSPLQNTKPDLGKDSKDILEEFDVEELAELYKKTTDKKRKQ